MIMKLTKDLKVLLLIYLILLLVPIFVHTDLYLMNILIMCLIWSVVAASWDLIMGFSGIFTFGQIAFFVIGAYSSAILTQTFDLSPWLGMPFGGVVAGLTGLLVGLPCLRLKGAYVALVTFAVHMILAPLLKSDLGRALGTGGSQGILTIKPLHFWGYSFSSMEPLPWFYTALFISLLCLLAVYRIIHSNWGLAFTAIRDAEPFAKSLGINGFKYKLVVFGITSFLTGIIGGFYAHYVGVLSTRILGLNLFLILMVMLVIGGLGRFPGAVIGAYLATFLSEWLRPMGNYRMLIFGGLVVLLVVYMPQGIAEILFPQDKPGPLERIRRRVFPKERRASLSNDS